MSARQRRPPTHLRGIGFEDAPALTIQSTDGDIPHGRELSFAWLSGTILTGLTGVLLMGATLFVSFQGQATFSTAYEALQILTHQITAISGSAAKTARARPVQQTQSEVETIEASVKQNTDGKDIIRQQPFKRIRATLATSATSLSDDVPAYDPVAASTDDQPIQAAATPISTDIYGGTVEGEVSVHTTNLPATLVPARVISDQVAAAYVSTGLDEFAGADPAAASIPGEGVHDLAVVTDGVKSGVAENITLLPKTRTADDATLGRTERILTVRESSPIEATLLKNGFTPDMITTITATLHNVYPSTDLPVGARLRILFGPSRNSATLIPYRMSIYVEDKHAATVALTDKGQYVLALAPPDIKFPSVDTEEINVANLPTIYRSIWETARKHDVPDDITKRIVGMFAYDIDETKKITAGDSIEMLESPPDAQGKQQLLFVNLKLGSTDHALYRFQQSNGASDFFDPNGDSGKLFLNRRPLQGGGLNISSPFGWRIHPIFHTRKLHEGVDFASQTGVPIYAAADGVVERAGWSGGYGQFVLLKHVNGFETGYGHMSKIASTTVPGAPVRQGQIIGLVGSTGNSTGPHLHFEVRINGNFVDPISVKLPRQKSLAAQDSQTFAATVAQIQDLIGRVGAPITVASN